MRQRDSVIMDDIICLICGASPDLGAPRNIGEWNDAGHTDSAHLPNWSITSFKGSEWLAHPRDARWYAEAVVAGPDGEDGVWGYADSTEPPSLDALSEWAIVEGVIARGKQNPDYDETDADIVERRLRA